ncbi:FAD-dependent oxidoreductase [Asticcacaulis sp. AC402]|uniref:flavin monoamine oxidase family protein n=1 Tax=Asticcacaulis sp. AC402 TaxID=1282361 RepID=UPI0004035957|nr:FAD-dependent oxidoreductase [Asticcacaulis sp. AC402]
MTTRRQILARFTAVAGFAGGYAALHALGLTGSEAWAGMPDLKPGSGAGVRVAIIGAGPAGLAAAYELGKAGYHCTLLEARDRAGGRNWTVRRGTQIEYLNGSKQICAFDEGQYFNAGPARIPAHHQATLGYCREFGVTMETEVNWSGRARIQADRLNEGKPIEMRQAIFDYRGHMAELLAKVGKAGALDQTFTGDDKDRLMEGLSTWGHLSEQLTYQGADPSGYEVEPAAGAQSPKPKPPLPLNVVGDPFVQAVSTFADAADFQATMQQPVGGMDRIPDAFEARLGNVIRKGCEVKRIRKTSKKGKVGVDIFYFDRVTGQAEVLSADYCICTMPLPVLAGIESDFARPVKAAIDKNKGINVGGYKIAFQSPRFWESNDHIYGGLSFTDRDTFATWYPSDRFHSPEGVIIAGYAFNGRMGERSLTEQIAYARETVDRLHPGMGGAMKTPAIVNWHEIPYSQGLAGFLSDTDRAAYDLLSQPDGAIYFAGDHLSFVSSWQQGAFCSAHRVVNMIAERQRALTA